MWRGGVGDRGRALAVPDGTDTADASDPGSVVGDVVVAADLASGPPPAAPTTNLPNDINRSLFDRHKRAVFERHQHRSAPSVVGK